MFFKNQRCNHLEILLISSFYPDYNSIPRLYFFGSECMRKRSQKCVRKRMGKTSFCNNLFGAVDFKLTTQLVVQQYTYHIFLVEVLKMDGDG